MPRDLKNATENFITHSEARLIRIMVQSWSTNPYQPLLNTLFGATRVAYFQSVTRQPGSFTAITRVQLLENTSKILGNSGAWRHWPLRQRCGFDKGSISVSEGFPEIPVTAQTSNRPRVQWHTILLTNGVQWSTREIVQTVVETPTYLAIAN